MVLKTLDSKENKVYFVILETPKQGVLEIKQADSSEGAGLFAAQQVYLLITIKIAQPDSYNLSFVLYSTAFRILIGYCCKRSFILSDCSAAILFNIGNSQEIN